MTQRPADCAEPVLAADPRSAAHGLSGPIRGTRTARPPSLAGPVRPRRRPVEPFERTIRAEHGLTERDGVFEALGRALVDAVGGRGQLAIVRGPMGSGKGAVLHRFLEAVEQTPALVLSATARRRESELPFGLLTQLFQNMRIPYLIRARVDELLAGMAARADDPDRASGTVPPQTVADFQKTFLILRKLAELNPVVVGVDNLHYADEPSLHWLCHVVPRIRAASALVVLTDDPGRHRLNSPLRSELFDQPHGRLLELGPLSPEGVGGVIGDRLGEDAARRLGSEFFQLSGGNPLILQNLLQDQGSDPGESPRGYSRALLSCLHRCEPVTLAVVRALAVLGEGAEPAQLALLAGAQDGELANAVHSLNRAGLLRGGTLRHPDAAADVLDDMTPQDRADLRRRAADVLRGAGASATAIAGQLVGAGHADFPWAADVLLDAAHDHLAADRVREAVDCLKLAQRTDTDDPFRAAIRARISRLEWLLGPTAPGRYLDPLVADASAGHLGAQDMIDLAWRLSWDGETGGVAEVLQRARDLVPEPAEDLRAVGTWLAGMYPARTRPRIAAGTPAVAAGPGSRAHPWLAAAALADDLIRGQAETIGARAEQVLQTLRLDFDSLWSAEAALLALLSLVYADKLEAAATWNDHLLAEARTRQAPTLRALFTATRAEISLRQGDLKGAAQEAQSALALLPARGWGVALGLPVGCLILANVRMGRFEPTARHLAQAFPEAMLQSRYGLHYLHARGHYRLATGHAQSALSDFLACGELMEGWAVRGAGPVPWRTSAAEAWIRLGNQDRAKQLVRDQLARLPPDSHRARGLSLRLLAAAGGASRRPQLLSEAVDVLKECGDKFELARALTDLSHAYRAVGDQRSARHAARRAWRIAKASGAEPLCLEIDPDSGDRSAKSPARMSTYAAASLSEQEKRVAALAGEGYTNQEISDQLFITASTVEQHLTRVFRKLNVKRRQELP